MDTIIKSSRLLAFIERQCLEIKQLMVKTVNEEKKQQKDLAIKILNKIYK